MSIAQRYRELRDEIPDHVTIVLAAKTRTSDEVREAIEAGAGHVGHNYVQEAVAMHRAFGEQARRVHWHLIGHLQKNKINKVLPVVDMIQTVDSVRLVDEIDRRAQAAGRSGLPVLLEINSGDEAAKAGVAPRLEPVVEVADAVMRASALQLRGLMTMAPYFDAPELARPYFARTRQLLEQLRERLPDAHLTTLSMGMSDTYRVAIEEGSTMVRLGSVVFGPRDGRSAE